MKWSQEMVNHSIVIWKREHMYDYESVKSDDYAVITGPTLVQFDERISVYYQVRQTFSLSPSIFEAIRQQATLTTKGTLHMSK